MNYRIYKREFVFLLSFVSIGFTENMACIVPDEIQFRTGITRENILNRCWPTEGFVIDNEVVQIIDSIKLTHSTPNPFQGYGEIRGLIIINDSVEIELFRKSNENQKMNGMAIESTYWISQQVTDLKTRLDSIARIMKNKNSN